MFSRKLSHITHSLLFRLTILYAVTFTVLATVGFLIFYYRIYDVTMEHLDTELRAESEKYTALMKHGGLKQALATIADESELEDPAEDFYRLFNFKGAILFSTDMSYWGPIATSGYRFADRRKPGGG